MRNIFDQYTQEENRLTHALLSTLEKDKKLRKLFIGEFVGLDWNQKRLKILEQVYPGRQEVEENRLLEKGIPDGWIYDSERALVVECKVASKPHKKQLFNHKGVAEKLGFKEIRLLLLTISPPSFGIEKWMIVRTWEELYEWLFVKPIFPR